MRRTQTNFDPTAPSLFDLLLDGSNTIEAQPAILATSTVEPEFVPTAIVLPGGLREYRLPDGRRHRNDGPAITHADGYEAWYQFGLLSRVGAPAVTMPDGSTSWWFEGHRHRPGGLPAVERVGAEPQYWVDGHQVRPGGTSPHARHTNLTESPFPEAAATRAEDSLTSGMVGLVPATQPEPPSLVDEHVPVLPEGSRKPAERAISLGSPGISALEAATEAVPATEAEASFPPRFVPGLEVLPPSSPEARTEANFAALRILRKLEAEARAATAGEQTVLAAWSSWGGGAAHF